MKTAKQTEAMDEARIAAEKYAAARARLFTAIHRAAEYGASSRSIGMATGFSGETVRRIVAERESGEPE